MLVASYLPLFCALLRDNLSNGRLPHIEQEVPL